MPGLPKPCGLRGDAGEKTNGRVHGSGVHRLKTSSGQVGNRDTSRAVSDPEATDIRGKAAKSPEAASSALCAKAVSPGNHEIFLRICHFSFAPWPDIGIFSGVCVGRGILARCSPQPINQSIQMKHSILCLAVLAMPMISQAAVTVYTTVLSGGAQNPPNASPATGTATVTIDSTFATMRVEAIFSGLTGNTTASHIHASATLPAGGNTGVATPFGGFPLGVTSGSYDFTFDMTQAASYSGSYITANGGTPAAAFTALQSQMANDQAYLNIHTTTFGGGEIRGFLTAVPEPGTTGLAALAGAGLLIRRRRSLVG
jgi:hypothetical protein